MDVGQHFSDAESELLMELRQYFPPNTPDSEIIGQLLSAGQVMLVIYGLKYGACF